MVHIASGTAALAAAFVVGRRAGFGTATVTPHNVPLVLLGAWPAVVRLVWVQRRQQFQPVNARRCQRLRRDQRSRGHRDVLLVGGVVAGNEATLGQRSRGRSSGRPGGDNTGGGVCRRDAGHHHWSRGGSRLFLRRGTVHKLRVDDSLDVFGIHGIGGMWGALATGIFVGIGFGALEADVSRIEQVLYQIIGIGAAFAWSFIISSIILLALKYTIGLRISDVEEEVGIDLTQHGEGMNQ